MASNFVPVSPPVQTRPSESGGSRPDERRPAESRSRHVGPILCVSVGESVIAAHGLLPAADECPEKTQFRCAVLELLDPTQYLGDELDGISCKTRKGNFEVNLPLIELYIPEDSRGFQLIEDYWYWFWNWR